MKLPNFLLLSAAIIPFVAGCASDRGGVEDTYSTDRGAGEGNPAPIASPSFRPGMNTSDPRDPHFTTRPDARTSPPAMEP